MPPTLLQPCIPCRRIFGLAPDATVQLTFGCRLPDNSGEVTLEGSGSFDAAVHLAAISAGQRLQRLKQQRQQEGTGEAAAPHEAPSNGEPGSGCMPSMRRLFGS